MSMMVSMSLTMPSLKVDYYQSTCLSAETIGCYAFVLLDSTLGNPAEKDSPVNNPSLRVGGISYKVPSGRRDGKVSREEEPIQNFPPPNINAQQLDQRFAQKGLSLDEMVTLSGAHSVGRPSTVGIVRNNTRQGETWAYKFAAAMVKMGCVDLLTRSSQDEIRKNCRFVN
uniref:peroxidase n=1 Tax=Quercus lobata TaxID=97700 RepID=A0A7N2L9J6_QUELO